MTERPIHSNINQESLFKCSIGMQTSMEKILLALGQVSWSERIRIDERTDLLIDRGTAIKDRKGVVSFADVWSGEVGIIAFGGKVFGFGEQIQYAYLNLK